MALYSYLWALLCRNQRVPKMKKLILLFAFVVGLGLSAMAQYCTPPHANSCDVDILIPSLGMQRASTFAPALPTACASTTTLYYAISGRPQDTLRLTEGVADTLLLTTTVEPGYDYSLWIDYNRNGVFEASEWTDLGRNLAANTAVRVRLLAPFGSAGATKARLRTRGANFGNDATDACTNFGTGVSYDFGVTIAGGVQCAGPLSSVNITGLAASVCAGDTVTLAFDGQLTSGGYTFLWQTSTDNGASWNPAVGASNSTSFRFPVAQFTAGTQFRLQVACAAAAGSEVNSAASTLTIKSANQCYCEPVHSAGCFETELLATLSAAGWAPVLPTVCTGFPSAYDLRSGDTLRLQQGVTATINGTTGDDDVSVSLWIDYNQNGQYEVGEYHDLTRLGGAGATRRAFTANIQVPANALAGYTSARVRTRISDLNGATDPCTSFGSGNSYDFSVLVSAGLPCTGTSVATITSTANLLCANNSTRLNATNYTPAVGLRGQWQSSTDNGTSWVALGGLDSLSFYNLSGARLNGQQLQVRFVLTCQGGSPGVSNVITLDPQTPTLCVCTPSNGTCIAADLTTQIFSVNQGFNLTLPTACTSAPNTGYFPIYGSRQDTLLVTIGQPFTFEWLPGGAETFSGSLYIDFNANGVFEPSEWTDLGRQVAGGTVSRAAVSVPATASGVVRGRFRTRYAPANVNINNDTSACTTYGSGHTYDFAVQFTTLTTLAQQSAASLKVYPNPGNGTFNLELPVAWQASNVVRIYDLAGKVVATPALSQLTDNVAQLKTNLPAGTYQLMVSTASGSFSRRLVVR